MNATENSNYSDYDLRTGELRNETVCSYCGTLARILPEFAKPDFHTSARCVEGPEPIR